MPPRQATPQPIAANSLEASPNHPLVRKLLFPQLDPAKPIPPIFDGARFGELNDEIHLFIALALRAFVSPWYTKITPRDKDFLPCINQILAHVFRSLQPRLAGTEPLTTLLLLDIPTLLAFHVETHNLSQSVPSHPPFGTLQPHIAVGREDDALSLPASPPFPDETDASSQPPAPPLSPIEPLYLNQIIDGVLRVLLPLEDYESDLERTIVREIIVRVVLVGLLRKLCQPWFWWQVIGSVLGPPKSERVAAVKQEKEKSMTSYSTSSPPSPSPSPSPPTPPSHPSSSSLSSFFESILNFLQTVLTVLQALYTTLKHFLAHLYSLPTPGSSHTNLLSPWLALFTALVLPPPGSSASSRTRRLTATIALWWLSSVGTFFSVLVLDRLLPDKLASSVLTPKTATFLVRKVRTLLFPTGYPGPSPVDPTEEEQTQLRLRAETRVGELVPPVIRRLLLSPSPSPSSSLPSKTTSPPPAQMGALFLAPISDSPTANAHLVVRLLDAIVAAVFPELAANGGGGGGEVDIG